MKTRLMNVRLSPDRYSAVEMRARLEGRTSSEWVRMAIAERLGRPPEEKVAAAPRETVVEEYPF